MSAPTDAGSDLERFEEAFPGLQVDAGGTERRFAVDYRRIATDRLSINRLRCEGRLRATGPLPEAVAVGRRIAGSVRIDHDGRSIDTSRPYLRPVAAAEFEVQDGAVMLIAVQSAALEEYMGRSGERGPLGRRVGAGPRATAWRLVMDHAATFLDDPGEMTADVAAELDDLLCWSLLQAFPDPWAETTRGGARSSALHRALRHLDEHADGVVTMPEAAAAARVSVRTLSLLFRRELGTTPFRWLQDLRLDRARLDLLAGSGPVAEVAARHGLPHAGRFAALYRARFGEHPATTLRGRFEA